MQVKGAGRGQPEHSPPHTLQASSLRNAARSVKDCCCVDRALRLLPPLRTLLLRAIELFIALFYLLGCPASKNLSKN